MRSAGRLTLEAKAPVTKGNKAAPADPTLFRSISAKGGPQKECLAVYLAIRPHAPVNILNGKTFPALYQVIR